MIKMVNIPLNYENFLTCITILILLLTIDNVSHCQEKQFKLEESKGWIVRFGGYEELKNNKQYNRQLYLHFINRNTDQEIVGSIRALRLLKQDPEDLVLSLNGKYGFIIVDRHQYGPKIIKFELTQSSEFHVLGKISCYDPTVSHNRKKLVYTHYYPRMSKPPAHTLAVHLLKLTNSGIKNWVIYPKKYYLKKDITPYELKPENRRSLDTSKYHWTEEDKWILFLEEIGAPPDSQTYKYQIVCINIDNITQNFDVRKKGINKRKLLKSTPSNTDGTRLYVKDFTVQTDKDTINVKVNLKVNSSSDIDLKEKELSFEFPK